VVEYWSTGVLVEKAHISVDLLHNAITPLLHLAENEKLQFTVS
jgi:hypothetical protein